ncbi:myomegalin isoform X2 [Spea bombifrons]|uniref:myomegalin isoform X2 n=1 Tax=Spea bombifrons TaxID=233779 RepID=UPI00234ABB0C|nr:myomegalin isoform X2 [Spea bombifrons]
MLDSKMKELCRICGRELYGNQRRWIFHTASKLNLQVVLTHVLGKEITRDGKAEFACSKCAFILERIYRFDTVIARIEALSIERLQKLLSEKDRLKHCLANLYKRNNNEEDDLQITGCEGPVDISNFPDVRYSALLQDDFVFSGFECWTELEEQNIEPQHCQHTGCTGTRPRKCRCCSTLRVADSDYEAVCKVPRKVARSMSCGPSGKCSASTCNEELTVTQPSLGVVTDGKASIDVECMEKMSSGSSLESLPNTLETGSQTQKEDVIKSTSDYRKCDCCCSNMTVCSSICGSKLDVALNLVKTLKYKPVQSQKGSRIPVKSFLTSFKLKSTLSSSPSNIPASGILSITGSHKVEQDVIVNVSDLHMWQDIYDDYLPLRPEMLQENLHQVSSELNIAQELSHKQSIIHTLKETLQDRDNEVAELYHRVDDLNGTIAKLEEMLHRKQAENLQASTVTSSQLQLLDLQNTLFCTKSELQKLQQTLRQKEQQLNNAKRSQLLLEADLVEGQQQKETTWKHNQELHEALHKLQGELDEKTLQLKNIEEEKCTKLQAQEHNIQHLNQTLSQNKQLIQEYMDLLEYQQSLYKCAGDNEHLVEKLHQRIKDRDAALQYAIDDKFCALEEKEKEMQQLKTFGRDKERDLEQLQSIVSANEETIISLDNLVKAKDMELEQIAAACRNLQWLLQKTEEINRHFLNEKDSIVQQLQSALEERSKEMEGMTACFLRSPALRSGELIEELKVCMEMKEKLLQSSLHSLSQQADEHKREIQELLDTIASEKMDQAIICRNCKLKEQQNLEGNLPHQLVQSGVLCGDLTSMCIRHESGDLKEAAEENEKAVTAEKNVLAKAKEDLQFFLRKEKEYQHELSALRCVIMKQSEQLQEQSADMDALTRSVQIKEDLIKDLQVQLVDPEEMPTVERLTQEVLVLKEKLASMEMDSQKCSGQCVQEVLQT